MNRIDNDLIGFFLTNSSANSNFILVDYCYCL